jgi:hypothetical protein
MGHFSDMPTGLLDVCLLGQSGYRSGTEAAGFAHSHLDTAPQKLNFVDP